VENNMATTLKPAMEARIADLARRLGYAGTNTVEQVLNLALDDLEAKTPQRRKFAPEAVRAMLDPIVESGKRWREENPYDDANPPSRVWQEELYDEYGLPK
jgi:hypothetical protein